MKNIILIGLSIIMFFFKSSAIANYEKTFFDLNIESISGDIINFSDFKNSNNLPLNVKSKFTLYAGGSSIKSKCQRILLQTLQ